MPLPSYLRETEGGVVLAVKVQPRASRNEIGEALGGELKIKITAPPVDSAANVALVKYLGEKLDCGRGRIELLRGQASRHKSLKLHGFTSEQVIKKLELKL